jgi:zinc protease
MKRVIFLILTMMLLLAACQPVQPVTEGSDAVAPETAELDAPLPIDPNVRIGTLDNGLTYYIRQNAEPEDRAELWLAVNAGSAVEDDDQQGLAHFVEHMLFNGTRRFEGQTLVDFFERIGMEFGPDVNAYTSWDETVYTLQVPTDDPALVEQGLDVLEDWAAYATLSPEEVDAERGVIVEEWRMRDLNAGGRTSEQLVKTLLANSRYAERMPIGEMEIVRNAPAETLKRFYTDWYRPDNQAVIAVGDFEDLDQIEAMIVERFSSLPQPANAVARPDFEVPDYGKTNYRVVTDPEYPSTELYVVYKQEPQPTTTVADLRDGLTSQLTGQMLNYRFDELTRKADAPFLYAGTGLSNLVRPVDVSFLFAQTEEGGASVGLDALMTEVTRARTHGFTPAELQRAKDDLLRSFKSAYDERNNIDNSAHADAYLSHFLQAETPLSEDDAYALAQELLPSIMLDEVNQKALKLFPLENRAVVMIAPEKADVILPSENELASVLEEAEARAVEAYAGGDVADALMASRPEPVAITGESSMAELGVTVITLTNGVEVYMKPTDFKDDEVLINISSPGGSSLVEDGDYLEADLSTSIVTQSGVAGFDQTELQKILAGKNVYVSPFIIDVAEGISAGGSPEDLETILQLIYLYLTQPRADEDALAVLQRQIDDYLKNRELTPESALEDAQLEIFCGDNIRCNYLDLFQDLDQFDLARSLEIYRERFADMSDAEVVIVGNFEPEQVKSLAQSYLGTLPGGGRSETWRDLGPELPQGIIEQTLNKGQDARSVVSISFSGPFTPTLENRLAARMVESVLDILVRQDLREARAGIYGAGVSVGIGTTPDPEYSFDIQFTAEPTRVNELVEAVFTQINDLRDNGPSADNFAKVHEQILRNHQENLKSNDAWATWLDRYIVENEASPETILAIETAIDNMTPEQVQAMAQQLFPTDRRVELILHPEGFGE